MRPYLIKEIQIKSSLRFWYSTPGMYPPRTPHREAGLGWEIKAAWPPCVLEVPEGGRMKGG